MRNRLLILGILGVSIVSCTSEKKNDTGVVDNVINEITTPKLFVEGEWLSESNLKMGSEQSNTKPYITIKKLNDSLLDIRIQAWNGRDFKVIQDSVKYEMKGNDTIIYYSKILNKEFKNLFIKYDNDKIKYHKNIGTTSGGWQYIVPFK